MRLHGQMARDLTPGKGLGMRIYNFHSTPKPLFLRAQLHGLLTLPCALSVSSHAILKLKPNTPEPLPWTTLSKKEHEVQKGY